MTLDEFSIIRTYFDRQHGPSGLVRIGIGDDAAVIVPPPGKSVVVTVDTLVEGVHFRPDVDPRDLGHKSVAVNLSDLAAMGAEPVWLTLSLTLPRVEPLWLGQFSAGMFALMQSFGVALVGGDLSRGPLAVTIQAGGWADPDAVMTRSGAGAGDSIWVSGTLGDAALGLKVAAGLAEIPQEDREAVLGRLHRPEPRIALGQSLASIASSAIDISDGLLQDLGHVLECSRVPGADLVVDRRMLSLALRRYVDATGDWSPVLSGGDDYELCVTAPATEAIRIEAAARSAGVRLTRIGVLSAEAGVRVTDPSGRPVESREAGFLHFQAGG